MPFPASLFIKRITHASKGFEISFPGIAYKNIAVSRKTNEISCALLSNSFVKRKCKLKETEKYSDGSQLLGGDFHVILDKKRLICFKRKRN